MLRKFYIGFALFLFMVSLFLGIDRIVHHHSSHFSLDKITSSYRHSVEWEIPELSMEDKEQLNHILNQKFTYYHKGSQSYIFISEDKKYILKFLNEQRLRPRSWLAYLPFLFNPYYLEFQSKQTKCSATFSSCKRAFLELKNETGLVYVQINTSSDLNKKITLLDKNGERHLIDLDKTSFCLQKRAQLIYSRISELMHQGDVEGAKNIISSIFILMDFFKEKGVIDNEPTVHTNFGLIDDVAVQINVGTLLIDPLCKKTFAYKRGLGSLTRSFRVWLEKNYPELLFHFEQALQECVSKEQKELLFDFSP